MTFNTGVSDIGPIKTSAIELNGYPFFAVDTEGDLPVVYKPSYGLAAGHLYYNAGSGGGWTVADSGASGVPGACGVSGIPGASGISGVSGVPGVA
jgi:hypothetical protein